MSSNTDEVRDRSKQGKGKFADEAAGSIKEHAGSLVGDQTLEAKGAIQKHLSNPQTKDSEAERHPVYKVVGIFPKFGDVADAIHQLNSAGIGEDRISVLGREQEHWQEKLGQEWEANKSAKGALVGGALGAVPGLVLVAGVALTGGVGLLVAGPMLGAMSALGMGSLVGGLMGAGSNAVDAPLNVEEEVANAISLGQWVVVVECHSDAEAAQAQELLPARRVVWDNKTKAKPGTDPVVHPVVEQTDLDKLTAVVAEAFAPVRKLTQRPVEEVMANIDGIDSAELKEAAQEAVRKIATATGLSTSKVADIFREHRSSDVNIVGVLHERSKAERIV
jgi:uncharacterized protein YjbJ (UPF0337 family)